MSGSKFYRELFDAQPPDYDRLVPPETAQTDAEIVDGRADRPIRVSSLDRGADILQEVAASFAARENELSGGGHSIDAGYWQRLGYAGVRALLLAGWITPDEHVIAVPNGLVLAEEQWRALHAGARVPVAVPGTTDVMLLRTVGASSVVKMSEQRTDDLWSLRERVREEQRRLTVAETERNDEIIAARVPRSFLKFMTQLAASLHADKLPGSEAAAHALDNGLALIERELREAGVAWHDRGSVPVTSTRVPHGERRKVQTTADHITVTLNDPTRAADAETDARLKRDILTVLRYVSHGRGHASHAPQHYPDFYARRALGAIDLGGALNGCGVGEFLGGPGLPGVKLDTRRLTDAEARDFIKLFEDSHPHLSANGIPPSAGRGNGKTTITELQRELEDARYDLDERRRDCQKVRVELLRRVAEHSITRDDVIGVDPEKIRAGYVANRAAILLDWYEAQVERLKREGSPGVVHEVDQASHHLVIKERNHAWVENAAQLLRIAQLQTLCDRLENEVTELRRDVRGIEHQPVCDGDADDVSEVKS